VPTFVSVYGISITKKIISFSTVLAALGISVGALGVGMTTGSFHTIWTLSAVLFGLSFVYFLKPSEKIGFFLYKYASVFMLANMILIISVGS
jgi:putative Mn2+ efflux pump MntP